MSLTTEAPKKTARAAAVKTRTVAKAAPQLEAVETTAKPDYEKLYCELIEALQSLSIQPNLDAVPIQLADEKLIYMDFWVYSAMAGAPLMCFVPKVLTHEDAEISKLETEVLTKNPNFEYSDLQDLCALLIEAGISAPGADVDPSKAVVVFTGLESFANIPTFDELFATKYPAAMEHLQIEHPHQNSLTILATAIKTSRRTN